MSKVEVIQEIRRRSHGVPEHFLAAFPTQELADYLTRLSAPKAPGRSYASMARTSALPAISCRAH